MSVEIVFPVEFVVEGVPASLQGKGLSLPRWKEKVAAAARLGLPEWHLLWEGPISVTILYFPGRVMADDIDNIIKPILDALCRLVYFDDQQVERLVVQKFEPGRPLAIENLT